MTPKLWYSVCWVLTLAACWWITSSLHFRYSHRANPGDLDASLGLPGSPIDFSLLGAWMAQHPAPHSLALPHPPLLPSSFSHSPASPRCLPCGDLCPARGREGGRLWEDSGAEWPLSHDLWARRPRRGWLPPPRGASPAGGSLPGRGGQAQGTVALSDLRAMFHGQGGPGEAGPLPVCLPPPAGFPGG